MNLLRGIFSIGIIIGCVINWVSIEIEIGIFGYSGLDWPPGTILLLTSFLTAGYAFYNSYINSNKNAWIYLTSGLYGIGICIYLYISLRINVNYLYMLDTRLTDLMTFSFGLGFYLTGLFSVLLFLTGFDKADSKDQMTQHQFDQQYSLRHQNNYQSEKLEKSRKPNLQDWLKENPGKSINDYFSKYR